MTTQIEGPKYDTLRGAFGEERVWSHDGAAIPVWEMDAYHLVWHSGNGSEARLRNLWSAKKGNFAYPVVLLAQGEQDDNVRVLGPQRPMPVREIPFDAVLKWLQECRDSTPHEAASVLAREFGRLEESVAPGVRVKDLLTPYFVKERLSWRDNRGKLDQAIENLRSRLNSNTPWRNLFAQLGYKVEQLPMRGYLLRWQESPVAVVHPLRSAEMFNRLDENGKLPEGTLLADCERQGAAWGLLAAQGRYRLFERDPAVGAAASQHIEFDLGELRAQDRFYLGLLAPSSLRYGGHFAEWTSEARDFGEELRRGLEERLIRDALPSIARGLGMYIEERGADLNDREELQRIEEAALTLVFRFMFLLHTEARGYLPVGSAAYRPRSARQIAEDSRPTEAAFSSVSTQRWDRLRTLVRMIRVGDPSTGVPAYNGSLFAADGFPGSDLLETAEITDNFLAPALAAIAYDTGKPDTPGLDFAGLQIGHLGAIYEALLTIRLKRAPEDMAYDAKRDVFRPLNAGETPEITRAQLFYQAEAGGRKAGGVFYTRHEFVRHLLENSLVPALEDHFGKVKLTAKTDPASAARQLFDFSVIDPAMGSAHFLTAALDLMTDRFELFLDEIGGLPAISRLLSELREQSVGVPTIIEDGDLLRRLILKRCIYGVDLSPMAVEVANVTLWLASFVPGLALSYLGSNLKWGDALIGVADPDVVGGSDSPMFTGLSVSEAMSRAAELQMASAENPDRTPGEVKRSIELETELHEATAGLRNAFDLWAAEPLGLEGARHTLETNADAIIEGSPADGIANEISGATALAETYRFFHWPLEFPNVFHRANPGFDVVVGNPPWNKVKFEMPSFLALHDPGIRGVRSGIERDRRAESLFRRSPELKQEVEDAQRMVEEQRKFFKPANGYTLQGSGDTDLYKLFCERYSSITSKGGFMGVVLPRVAFMNDGSRGFRRWLFRQNRPRRVDTILNNRRWAFPIHPQYSIALLAMQIEVPHEGALTITGPSRNESAFAECIVGEGVQVDLEALASWTPAPSGDSSREPTWELPLLPSQRHADVLSKLRGGVRFDRLLNPRNPKISVTRAAGQNQYISAQQRALFTNPPGPGRIEVWKGSSFDQYLPHGQNPAGYGDIERIRDFLQTKRARARDFRSIFPKEVLDNPDTLPFHSERIAFRAVSRATDSRTVISCLIPMDTPLTDRAPYIAFYDWTEIEQTFVLGIFNSLPFDWQARRYVETTLNYFILNGLSFPSPENTPWHRIGKLAARLSCVGERFSDFAAGAGIECGSLTDAERDGMRAEIDALVAHAYGITSDELRFIFTDFTENAVSSAYRSLVMDKFEEVAARWLADAGGSAPDMEYIPRRRSVTVA